MMKLRKPLCALLAALQLTALAGILPAAAAQEQVPAISHVASYAQAGDEPFFSVDFEDGTLPADWKQLGGSCAVKEENGNHFLEMEPNTRLIIPMPEGAGDYTIEADVTFMQASNSARWASIMYRVQDQDKPYYQFAVRQDATATNGVEFAAMTAGGAWDVRETASFTGKMDDGLTRHFKVTATGNRVKQWIDGKELIFTDKAADLSTGDIGLQSNLVTVRFDNLTVHLNPEALPDLPKPENDYAMVKSLSDNLVSAPTVIASGLTGLDDAEAKMADAVTSSLMLRAEREEDGLALYSGEARLGGIQDCMDQLYGKTLLLIELDDAETADALAAYIEENRLEDLQVAGTDGELLREFRAKAPATRASLMLDAETLTRAQAADAVGAANRANAKNIILKQSAANKEVVEQMQRLLLSVWVVSDDTATGLFRAVQSGANGVITAEPARLAALAECFTGRTLTRRSFIIGHRGTPGSAPENTMAGYRMAYEEYGAQMIENDVYLTKDKEVIVLHDDTFARTTDILTNTKLPDSVFTDGVTRQNCRPRDLTLEQVRMLDAGSYYGEEFAGEPVPTLREMLEYIKGKDLVLFLELKDNSEGIEKACTDMIKEFDMQDQVCCITFNAKSVPITLDEMPTMSIGYLSGVGSVNTANPMVTVRKALNQVLPMNSTFNPSYGAIHNETFVQQMQGRGMTLWPWTYNSQSAYQWAIDHGINGLTTNYADWSKDAVFGVEAEQNAYTLAEGETLSLKAVGKTNARDVVSYDAPEIVVLEGGEQIQVSGSAVTGVKAGTAVVSLRVKSQMGGTEYDLYTAPVTLTVSEGIPAEHMLTVTYGKNVSLSVDGISQKLPDLIGAYKDVVMAKDEVALAFRPYVDGRELAGATLNGEPLELADSEIFAYNFTMPNTDATLAFQFTVVNKMNLRSVIEIAEGCADEAASSVPAVQRRYEKALKTAQAVEANPSASQKEIDDAMFALIDALHYLSFTEGDKSKLTVLMEVADALDRGDYTADSLAALDAAYAAAKELVEAENALEVDVDAAAKELNDALENLVRLSDRSGLEARIAEAEALKLEAYLETGKAEFTAALAAAHTVLADTDATQKAIDDAEAALVEAMARLRLIPNKEALKETIDKAEAVDTNPYTADSVRALTAALEDANRTFADDQATQEEVDASNRRLTKALNGLASKDTGIRSGKKSTRTPVNTNTYGAEGTAVAGVNASRAASVVSDTTADFTLQRGNAYCFQMTVVNGSNAAPYFTVGNGNVLKTQFVARIGNNFHYRVYAIGAPGQSTGVYTQMPNGEPQKHCVITIV